MVTEPEPNHNSTAVAAIVTRATCPGEPDIDRSPRPFRFALCADDYAMTPGISRGIIELIERDALTATSAMTTHLPWRTLARELIAAPIDVGLHLNLTSGAPLGAMPHLARSGSLPSVGTLLRALPRVPQSELVDEIGRQLDGFAERLGRAPDHVDGHQHVHALPRIREALIIALAARRWRPWLRCPADRPMRIVRRRLATTKALGIAALTRGFRTRLNAAGLLCNDGFSGFSRFDPAVPYENEFARTLVAPGDTHLVMCHPGHVDDVLRGLDPVTETRQAELGFFKSPAFRLSIRQAGGTLARPSALITG